MKEQNSQLKNYRSLWKDLSNRTNKSHLRKALYEMFYKETFFDPEDDRVVVIYNDHCYRKDEELRPYAYLWGLNRFLESTQHKEEGSVTEVLESCTDILGSLPTTIDLLDVTQEQLELLGKIAQDAAIVAGSLPQDTTFVEDLMQHYYPGTTMEEEVRQQERD